MSNPARCACKPSPVRVTPEGCFAFRVMVFEQGELSWHT